LIRCSSLPSARTAEQSIGFTYAFSLRRVWITNFMPQRRRPRIPTSLDNPKPLASSSCSSSSSNSSSSSSNSATN